MCPEAVRPAESRRWRTDAAIFLCVALFSSLWCLSSARQLGPTFDETLYVNAGLDFWRTGNPRELLANGVMPLSSHLQTLPLAIIERATGQRWQWPEQAADMLAVARSVTVVFWWLLLFYGMRIGRELGGPWAGRLAVLLLGAEPNLLAHASLATTDLLLATSLLIFTYHFRAGRESGWRRRIAGPAILFGVAVLAKPSAILLGSIAMFVVELERYSRIREGTISRAGTWKERIRSVWEPGRRFVLDGLLVGGIGLVLAVAYCGSGGGPSFQTTIASLPLDNPVRPLLAWIGGLPLFPNGVFVIWFQITHNLGGHASYLVGRETFHTAWYDLAILLGIKVPLATLLLLAAALLLSDARVKSVLALAAMLWLIGVGMGVQVGIRVVLPVVAFLIIAVAARLSTALAAMPATARRIGIAGVALAVSWLVASDVRVWPDAIRYTNEMWGNTDRGYLFVSDSNYDWGQGLPELAAWQQSKSARVRVWYFGTDTRYPTLVRFDPNADTRTSAPDDNGYFAVGTTWLYGGYARTAAARALVARLRAKTPVARTRTFLIFEGLAP